MARPISALTKFILSLPHTTPVADVMVEAKAKGMPTSKGNVHQVRAKYELGPGGVVVKKGGMAKPAGKKATATVKEGSAKKTAPKKEKAATGKRPSPKKEALLAIGFDKSTADIIASAKAKGVKVSATYVDLLRKAAGKTPSPTGKAAVVAKPKKAAPKKAKATTPTAPKRGPGRPPNAALPVATKRRPGRPRKAAAHPAPAPTGDSEKAMKAAATAVVLAHGIARAQAVLDGVIARIRAAGAA